MVRVFARTSEAVDVREGLRHKGRSSDHNPSEQVLPDDLDLRERMRLSGPGYGLGWLAHWVKYTLVCISLRNVAARRVGGCVNYTALGIVS